MHEILENVDIGLYCLKENTKKFLKAYLLQKFKKSFII